MNPVIRHMRWIMVVSGVLTATMIYAAIAPEAALRSTFGETLEGRHLTAFPTSGRTGGIRAICSRSDTGATA